jgi:hypothetical protein
VEVRDKSAAFASARECSSRAAILRNSNRPRVERVESASTFTHLEGFRQCKGLGEKTPVGFQQDHAPELPYHSCFSYVLASAR